jgi:spermidine synthase
MADTPGQIVRRDYWNGHLVEIVDNGDHRSLYFGSGHLQSRMSLSRPQALVLSYTWYMLASLLLQPQPEKILIVGIGSGSFVRFFHHHFPNCRIDAVDYSPHIIDVARGYFHLPENDRVTVHCLDGFEFLQDTCTTRYDLILVDAFDDLGMAPTIYSQPFFSLCREHLGENGVVSCNLWSDDMIRYRQIKTILADLFTDCLMLPVPERGNRVALAMPFAVPWPKIYLKRGELALLSKRFGIDFKQLARVAKQNNLSLARRLVASFS